MSEENWKLEKNLCRCCHSEGDFKNLADPCSRVGQEEIYCDMLQECLDIIVSPVPGPLCSITYTICEDCILRLRDACSFKQQVTQCEERFHDLYNRDVIKISACFDGLPVKVELDQEDVKIDISRMDEDEDFDLKYDDEDDDDNSEVMDIKEDEKARPKKPQTKEKPKQKRNANRSRKLKSEEGDKSDKDDKKGKDTQIEGHFTIVNDDVAGRLFRCNVCARTYTKRVLFSQHYRHVHLKLRPKLRSCYYCDVRVAGHLRARHLEEAHGITRPTCNACGKKFAFPFQVIHHQKQFHMDEKMYPCPKCDLKFTVPSQLSRHQAKHIAIRPYKCELCEKTFKWKKNLKTHVMIHMNDRRQVCGLCDAAFVQQTSLKYHIMKKHPGYV